MNFDDRSPSPTLALLRREMLVLSRHDQLYRGLGILVALLVGIALLLLLMSQASGMAIFSRRLFGMQFRLLLFAAIVVVPALAASAMVTERKHGCFPLLYTTLIPPGWIVWSKMLAVLGVFAMFYIGCLPFVGLAYFYAGVDVIALFQSALVLFSVALGTASIGLCASSGADSHGRALYRTGAGVAAALLVPAMLLAVFSFIRPNAPAVDVLSAIAFHNAYRAGIGGIAGWHAPLSFAGYQACLAAGVLLVARRRVLPDRTGWRDRIRLRFHRQTAIPRQKFSRSPIADGQNPIAIKDYWTNPLGGRYRRYVLGVVGLGIGLLLAVPTYMAQSGAVFVPYMFALYGLDRYIFFIILPPMMATMLAAERESETFDSLRVTLLNESDIVRGKIRGAWRLILPLLMGIAAGKTLVFVTGAALYWRAPYWGGIFQPLFGMLILFATVYAILCLSFAGALSRRTTAASIVASYAYVLMCWLLCSIPATFIFAVLPIVSPAMTLLPLLHSAVFYLVLIAVARSSITMSARTLQRQARTHA